LTYKIKEKGYLSEVGRNNIWGETILPQMLEVTKSVVKFQVMFSIPTFTFVIFRFKTHSDYKTRLTTGYNKGNFL
jgi:hypothetical protein